MMYEDYVELSKTRLWELGSDLEVEKAAKVKAEKQKVELQRSLDGVENELEEARREIQAHENLSKRKEGELERLRGKFEYERVQNEKQHISLEKQHNEDLKEMAQKTEELQKEKRKVDKENDSFVMELEEFRSQNDSFSRLRSVSDKTMKDMDALLMDNCQKLQRMNNKNTELEIEKSRLSHELSDKSRKQQEDQVMLQHLSNTQTALTKKHEEQASQLKDEGVTRDRMLTDYKACQAHLESTNSMYEEEHESRTSFQKAFNQSHSELQELRRLHDTRGYKDKSEEVEDLRKRIAQQKDEFEKQLEAAACKNQILDKIKNRMQNEIDYMSIEVEKVNCCLSKAEKRQRVYEKSKLDCKKMVEDIQSELDKCQTEHGRTLAEMLDNKKKTEEHKSLAESERNENIRLHERMEEMSEVLRENEKKRGTLDKEKRHLEMEIGRLHSSIAEYETSLGREEVKQQRVKSDLLASKHGVGQKIAEKEEEFETTKRNHLKALQSMQATLEAESRGKAEAFKTKRKCEAVITEMEVSADMASRCQVDMEKTIKRLQTQLHDYGAELKKQTSSLKKANETCVLAKNKAVHLENEKEKMTAKVQELERMRKRTEVELMTNENQIRDLKCGNSNLLMANKQMESTIYEFQIEIENHTIEMRQQDDLFAKVMKDMGRNNEDLKKEKELHLKTDELKVNLENELKEMNLHYENLKMGFKKGDKNNSNRLEMRMVTLETELLNEQKHRQATETNLRQQEKWMKERVVKFEEDKKTEEKLSETIDDLNRRIKVYTQQLQELEKISSVNLSKYRKAQLELEEAQKRAENAELHIARLKTRSHCSTTNFSDHSLSYAANFPTNTRPPAGRGYIAASRERVYRN